MDYLGGERSDSIYALLAEEGYNVDIWNEGLGENPYVQDLFLKHLGQAIRMSDRKRSSQRRIISNCYSTFPYRSTRNDFLITSGKVVYKLSHKYTLSSKSIHL